MKKNLLITGVILIASFLNISAQDTLKVNFKQSGTVNEVGWDSILVADKQAFSGSETFVVFGGTVFVEPVWLTSPDASNTRSISRSGDTENYSGPLKDMLSTYIAVDSRTTNNCDAIGVKISGLPAGKYIFTSYHHDFRDQFGSFTASVSVNSKEVEAVEAPFMISHSVNYEVFTSSYGALEADVEAEWKKHFVVASLDSLTKFTSGEIVSSATSDEIIVSFKNELAPDAEMSHNLKLILINGFTLAQSKNVGISSSRAALSPEIKVVSELGGKISITSDSKMANVKLFNVAGQLVKEINNAGDKAEFSNLRKGIYLVKVSALNGGISSKKIIAN